MELNRIIVVTSPVEVMQKVFVFQNGELKDQLPVPTMELQEVLPALVEKYNIVDINFTGAKVYAQKIGDELEKTFITKYGENKVTISYS